MSGEDEQSSSVASSTSNNQLENIKVAVRIRPFTEREKQRNNRRIVDIQENTVFLYNANYSDATPKKFTFDYSYWSHDGFKKDPRGVNVPDPYHPNYEKYVGQEKVFEDLGCFLLCNALKGYNSALLAYGPTGSGKSYTISGYGQNEGILPRFARALFNELEKSIKKPIDDEESKKEESSGKSEDENTNSSEPENVDKGERQEKDDSGSFSRYEVFFSMLEIYNEVVRDLLAKNCVDVLNQTTTSRRGLKVREHPKHGFFVENLTSYLCADKTEIEKRIEDGLLNKSIAATSMNETSSRGHTIYEFRIKQYRTQVDGNHEETVTTSMVQLVDLAGSERMAVHAIGQIGGEGSRANSPFPQSGSEKSSKTSSVRATSSAANGSSTPHQSSSLRRPQQTNATINSNYQKRFKESVSINQSLSALGNCIQVMSQYSQQVENNAQIRKPPPKIPYRDSVLTKLLNRCSLSGNSKVVIIATLSPVEANYEDTLSTLRFADRAKRIRTHVIINRSIRTDMVDNLQKENERLKQLVGGGTARSDDSSQTSNFDESENLVENFNDPSSNSEKLTNIDTTPRRSRTTVRRNRDDSQPTSKGKFAKGGSVPSPSNPSLIVREQMKRLVSPASRKQTNSDHTGTSSDKSRGTGTRLDSRQNNPDTGRDPSCLDDDLIDEPSDDELEDELIDIKEGLISPESEDSYSALADEDLTDEEKIAIFNKLLSNATVKTITEEEEESSARKGRPKKANRNRAEIKQVSTLSSNLKKTNPYLSNLNPDEQLTGMISYIIKHGETIIGKGSDCDIVLHGLELRAKHAKITRVAEVDNQQNEGGQKENSSSIVYIEPVFEDDKEVNIKEVALMVNGFPVIEKTRLNHCDRLLFGTSAYFVYSNSDNLKMGTNTTVADLDMVTFDMAKNEVIKKILTEEKNEDIIKEINDYTYRPGTGKHKAKFDEFKEKGQNTLSKGGISKLQRSITVHDQDGEAEEPGASDGRVSPVPNSGDTSTGKNTDKVDEIDEATKQEMSYRDQLMNDTYEYAMPVAEVNAVAKEMGIRVTYELKILTAEEQLSDVVISSYADSSISDGFNSASMAESESDRARVRSGGDHTHVDDRVSNIIRLDHLDIPPALYVKVYEEELDTDFYWSKEKFAYRRCKILELYGSWDVGGKPGLVEYLIDQSRAQNGYLIDPFVDDPSSTLVLIGNAQITLEPLAYRREVRQQFEIVDMNDVTVGSINIEAIPCNETLRRGETQDYYDECSEEEIKANMLKDPKDLLGKKLIFVLKVVSCRDLPQRYSNIFCQYTLTPGSASIKTKTFSEDSLDIDHPEDNHEELIFNHSHFICFERVNQDALDFLEHGFLAVQVVGQYKLSETMNRSPTVVSTIISSINKYRSKLEQQHSYYPSSSYYNSNTNSTKSAHGRSSGPINSNSGASSTVSTSATVNLFDQQNEDDEGGDTVNGISQENIIDMILTKRKLDRAENQLHYLKRTVNIAEHYNKKHIPVKTVKKLLTSYGHELDTGSLDEMATDATFKGKTSKNSTCIIQ